ncbi:MAG: glycine--tRNA ligase subunit beta [Candidatus Dasytiphilus stammeri]
MNIIKKTFLIEIGTEELPSKGLYNIAKEFTFHCIQGIQSAKLSYGNVDFFASPRRIAIKISDLSTIQPDIEIKKYGPALLKAFDTIGNLTPVAKLWLQECNITIKDCKILKKNKKKFLTYCKYLPGKLAVTILPDIIKKALLKKTNQRLMRWGIGDIKYIRPVNNVTLLLGEELIYTRILGLVTSRRICGHRFMGKDIYLQSADQYPNMLLTYGKVIAHYESRKNKIIKEIIEAASYINGKVYINNNIIEEVTSLVEWPVILTAKINKEFLVLPIIKNIIEKHKAFLVYGNNNELLPNFIFIANIESKFPQKIINDNEKVINVLLSDADYLFKIDRKKKLLDYLNLLDKVLFHPKLGTLLDKTKRIEQLIIWIAKIIKANVNNARRAALLAKCDLMTNMVSEFTDAQGIIGMYYARLDGEEEEVAIALKDQYMLCHNNIIPTRLISCALLLADKIDYLIGMIGIGIHPKGNQDPYALRRNAIGILRIIIRHQLNIDLQYIIKISVNLYKNKITNPNVETTVINFILNRLLSLYQSQGYKTEIIQSVLAINCTNPLDLHLRIKAISNFYKVPTKISILIALNKRINNILAKSSEILNEEIDMSLLRHPAEIKLEHCINTLIPKIKIFLTEYRYEEIFLELTKINKTIDNFFKNVMINDENKAIHLNRVKLLFKLKRMFLLVADISYLR